MPLLSLWEDRPMSPGAGRLAFRADTLTATAPCSRLLSCFLCDRDWHWEWVPGGRSLPPSRAQALRAADRQGASTDLWPGVPAGTGDAVHPDKAGRSRSRKTWRELNGLQCGSLRRSGQSPARGRGLTMPALFPSPRASSFLSA